ncbi:PREDICTED: transmembrane channel-like protein 5 isoform X2 [Acromyrmex echinatior]|uniref:transmembrane channel-like protein 5 isoform X2 n=1 Tax=Acromyrmex echinatior TaxID=103372 RepID=UPI000580E597|nr:PREDICTED: transmembrane channel-like protein 5 isoform X2 [Acromyrmex echinatior]
MPFEIQEAELCESFDQSIQMEQLLPMELGRKHEGILDLNSIIPYATLRMRNVAHLSNEECANAIASHLQSSEKFMHDDPKLEQFRMETVRTIPQCLAVKQSVKLQLLETVNQKTTKRSISCWKLFKYNVSLKFTKIWITMQNFLSTMKLWHRTIKTIESHHGSGIATYFKFLRWLFFLNTISCILSVSFIVIPQSLDQVYVSNDIKVLDFLTGSGFLSHTIMYYGFYSNGTVDVSFGTKYSIPFAYFLTLLFCYIVTFVILSLKVISSYRKSYVETRGKVHNLYSSKIFCGWDFSISSPKTAVLQSASIYKELEELLAETKQHMRLHWCTKFLLIIIQFAATSIVIFMIFGAGALVWILLSHYNIETPVTISIMIVPIVITAIIHIFPAIISYLALLERYNNKRTELYVTIVRNYAVAAIIIGTLFIFWITHRYVITNVKSDECGPFRNHLHTWDFIVDGMLSLKRDSTFWKVISELASPVTGAVILIGMSIAVYCLRAKAEASKEISRIFSNMLLLQSQDKQFLINSFGKCAENKHTFVPNEISFVQDIRHIEQDCTNEEALLHRHNLPSTSFEER